jgi:hypothetical protein
MKGVVVCPQPRAADVGAAILSRVFLNAQGRAHGQ